jgi:hypothetical protein
VKVCLVGYIVVRVRAIWVSRGGGGAEC